MKITINNRKINQAEFRETVLMPMEGDKYDSYRIDYNKMLEQRSQSSNGVTQDKYITVTVNRENIEDARIIFNRVAAEFESKFKALQSSIQELSSAERIEILRSFFHPEEEAIEGYDPMEATVRRTISSRILWKGTRNVAIISASGKSIPAGSI